MQLGRRAGYYDLTPRDQRSYSSPWRPTTTPLGPKRGPMIQQYGLGAGRYASVATLLAPKKGLTVQQHSLGASCYAF